jgi:putative cell wall-binding protein
MLHGGPSARRAQPQNRVGAGLAVASLLTVLAVMVAVPADAQPEATEVLPGTVGTAMHAKGRGAPSSGVTPGLTATTAVRPVNTLACTAEVSGADAADCQCGPVRTPVVDRVAGPNRFATAASLVPAFRNEIRTVYIVNGFAFADAASAASAAGAGVVADGYRGRAWAPAPLLLTRAGSLPTSTRSALRGLSLNRIIIVGGRTTVSDAVERELKEFAPSVYRAAGRDRYATSATLATRFPIGTDTVYLASGQDAALADALTGGAWAGQQGAPVLLTRPDRVDPATRDALDTLQPSRVVVLGGPGAVSSAVYTGVGADERVAGANRYGTAVAIARRFADEQSGAFVASGQAFPDALTGAALAASLRQPLLLSGSTRMPDVVMTELERLSPARFTLLGGPSSLNESVETQANRYYPGWVR